MNSSDVSTEDTDAVTVHWIPRYNQYGNRQVWFVETGSRPFDDVLNGAIFAVALALWFLALAYARGGRLL